MMQFCETHLLTKVDVLLWFSILFGILNKLFLDDLLSALLSHKSENHTYSGTQPTFTCSKLTLEILEQGVKYVQS